MKNEIWKVLMVKEYADASNHLVVGQVLDVNQVFIRMECRAFHYRTPVLELNKVIEGEVNIRIIPWAKVECAKVLDPDMNWKEAQLVASDKGIRLTDLHGHDTLIYRKKVN